MTTSDQINSSQRLIHTDFVDPKYWNSIKYSNKKHPVAIVDYKYNKNNKYVGVKHKLNDKFFNPLTIDNFEYILTNNRVIMYKSGHIQRDYSFDLTRKIDISYAALELPPLDEWKRIVLKDKEMSRSFDIKDCHDASDNFGMIKLIAKHESDVNIDFDYYIDNRSLALDNNYLYAVIDTDGIKHFPNRNNTKCQKIDKKVFEQKNYGPDFPQFRFPRPEVGLNTKPAEIVYEVSKKQKDCMEDNMKKVIHTISVVLVDEDNNLYAMPEPEEKDGWEFTKHYVFDLWKEPIIDQNCADYLVESVHHKQGKIWLGDFVNIMIGKMKILETVKFIKVIKKEKVEEESLLKKLW